MSDPCDRLRAQLAELTAERDTLQNEVYDLKHVIQHWEVDAEGLKDDLTELREAYDLLHKRIEAYDETHAYLTELREAAEYAVNEWANGMPGRGMERAQAVLAKLTP